MQIQSSLNSSVIGSTPSSPSPEAVEEIVAKVNEMAVSHLTNAVPVPSLSSEPDEKAVYSEGALDIYSNIIKRLPLEIKSAVVSKRTTLSDIPGNIKKIVETPIWDPANLIFNSVDHYYYALEGVKSGEITQQQFGTLMLFRTELEHSKVIKRMPLLDVEGQLEKEAAGMIMQTLYPGPAKADALNYEKQEADRKEQEPLLNSEQMEKLTKLLSQLPKSEQQFLLVAVPETRDSASSLLVTDAITYGRGFNVFSRVLIKDTDGVYKLFQMIPSIGMMQAFLDVFAGEDAPILDPVLGDCDLEDFEQDALNGTRKMGINFHNAPQREKADRKLAPGNTFTLHDFYHAFVAACMPKAHRLEMQKASTLLKGIGGDRVNKLKEYLLDMENIYYTPHNRKIIGKDTSAQETLDRTFWGSLALHCLIFTGEQSKRKKNPILTKILQRFVQYFAVQEKGKKSGDLRKGP